MTDPRARLARLHLERRLFERHGIAITETEWQAICAACRAGRAVASARAGGEIHVVALRGKQLPVVFRRADDVVVTALPPVPQEVLALRQSRGGATT
jgi:hypothetical protein